MPERIKKLGSVELRQGRWQDVLDDVLPDVLVSDPPYSEKTRKGHDAGDGMVRDGIARQKMGYPAWSERDVEEFCQWWAPRTRGWFVAFTDHVLYPIYERTLWDLGRYVFPPLPSVEKGMTVRRQGDGHSSWTTWVVTARPRTKEFATWGTLQGAYILPPGFKERRQVVGQKTLWLMDQVIRDHSRPGDLVVDPCCGSGSTLVAAALAGRNALGAERDEDSCRIALTRVRAKGAVG